MNALPERRFRPKPSFLPARRSVECRPGFLLSVSSDVFHKTKKNAKNAGLYWLKAIERGSSLREEAGNKPWRLLPAALLLALVCTGTPRLMAQNGIYDRVCNIPGPGTVGSLPEENIDLFTGNISLKYRDVYLSGPNGRSVEIWWVYNSKILKDRESGDPIVQPASMKISF